MWFIKKALLDVMYAAWLSVLSAAISGCALFASAASIAYSNGLLITQASSNCHLASSLDECGNSLIKLTAACIAHLGAIPSVGLQYFEHVHGGSSISPGSGVGTSLCYLGAL